MQMLNAASSDYFPDALAVSTRPGGHLPRRLRRRRQPVSSVARRSRITSGAAFLQRAGILELSESVPRPLLGRVRDGARLDGVALSVLALSSVFGKLRHSSEHDGLGADVAALPVVAVNVGQTWYSFGWESLLLETGFLAIFFGAKNVAPPVIVVWLLRWVLFRSDVLGRA